MPELTRERGESRFHSFHERHLPAIGSEEEINIFKQLQDNFSSQYESVFPDHLASKTVVVLPSLTLDQEILQKIEGVVHYEERLLCLLMLLRMPRTHVIFLTSVPIDQVIVDYYLHLLPGVTGYHSRQRLTLLSCFDASPRSLTEKILERPRLIARIKNSIPPGHMAHIAPFNVTDHERTLAVRLGIPLYGCDPQFYPMGNKSNGRKLFKLCNLPIPHGYEDLTSEKEVAEVIRQMKKDNPELKRVVIKMNEGFSGEGNATYTYPHDLPNPLPDVDWFLNDLPERMKVVAPDLSYKVFMQKFSEDGGIVEAFVFGEIKTSPSTQCLINPLGKVHVVSTHDQVLGGQDGQVFLGAHFPANKAYASEIGEMGHRVGEALCKHGAIGRFSIDFISVKEPAGWKHYAIEINLRKGGTTHPYLMLEYLTQGNYHTDSGEYQMANGQLRYYFSSDNLYEPSFRGLTPHDLIDIAMVHELRYDGSTQEGVVFHLIGALSQYGKLGVVCIGSTPEKAQEYYLRIVDVLLKECRR